MGDQTVELAEDASEDRLPSVLPPVNQFVPLFDPVTLQPRAVVRSSMSTAVTHLLDHCTRSARRGEVRGTEESK